MNSEPSSPRRDTSLDFESHGNNAAVGDPLNRITSLTYRVTRGVMTIVNADDPATTGRDDNQTRMPRRGRTLNGRKKR